MSEPVEKEYKILLTPQEYEVLQKSYDYPTTIDQTNQYYDTPDGVIAALPGALRIRKKDGKNIFTLKVKIGDDSHYEFEKEVDTDNPANITDPEVLEWMERFGIDPSRLEKSYFVHTIRQIFNNGLAEVALDANDFGSFQDYEMEYEYRKDHDGLTVFNELLKPAGLVYEKNCPSKLARAASATH